MDAQAVHITIMKSGKIPVECVRGTAKTIGEEVPGMTYEEAYMQCKSIEELERMVNRDIKFARVFNIDRIPIIEKSAIKVANLKFNEGEQDEL